MTPTTAAVIAENAAFSPLLPRRFSMNGAPAKIQRKHGVNVTQVANPPNVPASSGCSKSTHDQRAGRRLRHTETVEHFARLEPAMDFDRLLRHIGQNRIGAAECDHSILLKKT